MHWLHVAAQLLTIVSFAETGAMLAQLSAFHPSQKLAESWQTASTTSTGLTNGELETERSTELVFSGSVVTPCTGVAVDAAVGSGVDDVGNIVDDCDSVDTCRVADGEEVSLSVPVSISVRVGSALPSSTK